MPLPLKAFGVVTITGKLCRISIKINKLQKQLSQRLFVVNLLIQKFESIPLQITEYTTVESLAAFIIITFTVTVCDLNS